MPGSSPTERPRTWRRSGLLEDAVRDADLGRRKRRRIGCSVAPLSETAPPRHHTPARASDPRAGAGRPDRTAGDPITRHRRSRRDSTRRPRDPACSGRAPARADHILPRQFDHVGHQACLVLPAAWHVPLRRAVLAQHPARPPLRDPERLPHPVDAPPATRRAQKFPLAASARISLSSVRSDTARRRRSFSFCRHFSSRSCSVPMPPYAFRQRS